MEAARHALLKHEASVKSIGTLYYLGGIFLVWGGLAALSSGEGASIFIGALLGAFGALELWLASGLWKLQRKVRVPAMILAGIGLLGFPVATLIFAWIGPLGFPVGTIVSAYILYLLGGQKGVQVFSDEYAQVIAATPHIKYKLSIVTKVVLVILVVLVAVGVVASLL